jgi:hypothetical protein
VDAGIHFGHGYRLSPVKRKNFDAAILLGWSNVAQALAKSGQDDDLAVRLVLLHAAVRLDDVIELEHPAAPLGTAAPEVADLSPVRGSGSAFATMVVPTKRAAPRTICLAGLGMSYLCLLRGLPVVTQRDLDGTIACHDQRSSVCRWPMRGRTSFVPDACYWTKIQ